MTASVREAWICSITMESMLLRLKRNWITIIDSEDGFSIREDSRMKLKRLAVCVLAACMMGTGA